MHQTARRGEDIRINAGPDGTDKRRKSPSREEPLQQQHCSNAVGTTAVIDDVFTGAASSALRFAEGQKPSGRNTVMSTLKVEVDGRTGAIQYCRGCVRPIDQTTTTGAR